MRANRYKVKSVRSTTSPCGQPTGTRWSHPRSRMDEIPVITSRTRGRPSPPRRGHRADSRGAQAVPRRMGHRRRRSPVRRSNDAARCSTILLIKQGSHDDHCSGPSFRFSRGGSSSTTWSSSLTVCRSSGSEPGRPRRVRATWTPLDRINDQIMSRSSSPRSRRSGKWRSRASPTSGRSRSSTGRWRGRHRLHRRVRGEPRVSVAGAEGRDLWESSPTDLGPLRLGDQGRPRAARGHDPDRAPAITPDAASGSAEGAASDA
jgi:hypothetical protein